MNYTQLSTTYKNSKNVRSAKRWLLLLVCLLVLVDLLAFLTLKNRLMPTVSREVLHSVPLFTFVIWVAGIATASVFFPQVNVFLKGYHVIRKVLTIEVIILLFIGGIHLHIEGQNKTCGDLTNAYSVKLIKVECILTAKDNYKECNCAEIDVNEICRTKLNFTVPAKIILFLFGVLWGIFIWPRRIPNST